MTKPNSNPPTRRRIAFVLAASTLIAACGMCDDESSPAEAPKVIETAAPEEQSKTGGAVAAAAQPAAEADDVQSAAEAEAEAAEQARIAAQLLGRGRKSDPNSGVVAAVARAGGARPVNTQPRRRRRTVVEDEEPEEAYEEVAPTTLSDTRFHRTVNNWRGVKSCLTSGIARGRDPHGALSVLFSIKSDGSVARATVQDANDPLARQISGCVSRQARKIRFPTWDGAPVSKQAKFVF